MSADGPDAAAIAGSLIGFTRLLGVRLRETPNGTGLAFAELQVLGGIARGYDLSSTLVRTLLLDAPRVSRIVDGFVTSGYVAREPDPLDRRRCRLHLTPDGAEYLARGRGELEMAMKDLLGGLTEEECAGLKQAVPGMRRVLARRTAPRDDSVDLEHMSFRAEHGASLQSNPAREL